MLSNVLHKMFSTFGVSGVRLKTQGHFTLYYNTHRVSKIRDLEKVEPVFKTFGSQYSSNIDF